jgi:transposase
MKTYQLKPSTIVQPAMLARLPSLLRRLTALENPRPGAPPRPWVCVGADLEKAGACLAVQVGAEGVCAGGNFTRTEIIALVQELRARGWRVALGVEACGFGWHFQGRLRAAGATVFTFATEALTGRRKTNRRDAAALGQLVAGRVVHGDAGSGRVVREPSREEQQRRYLTRHRAQLVSHRGRVEAQGRGLLYDHGIEAAPECWWGKKTWPRLAALLEKAGEGWLRGALAKQRELALSLHAQVRAMDAEIEAHATALAAAAPAMAVPHGLGELTALTLQVEVMDWHRFSNRKKAGSFIGCSPSEYSTGPGGQVLGNIDRQGNRRLRSALVEAIWRLLRWNPGWRGFAKWGALLRDKKGSSVRKKKAVIACVRLLFIDLWRLHTGRTTLDALGLRAKAGPAQQPMTHDE